MDRTLSEPDPRATAGETIAKQAGLTVGWNVLAGVLRFLSGVLIARLYSIEWLGVFAIAQSIARITSDVGNLGLDQGLVRYASRLRALGRYPQLRATVRAGILYSIAGGAGIGLLVGWAAGDLGAVLLRTQETQLTWMIAGFAVAIPLMTISQVLAAVLQGFERLGQRAIALDVLPQFVICAGLLALRAAAAPRMALTVSFVTAQLVAVLSALWFLRRVPLLSGPRSAPEPELLSYSLPLMLTSFLSNVARWGDVILLGLLSTAEATGLYQFAARIAGVLSIVTTSVAGIFAPVVSRFHAKNDFGQIRLHLRLVTRWCFSFSWPVFLFVALFGGPLLGLFGDEFPRAAASLVVLTAGHLLWSLVAGNMMLLSMTGYPRLNLINMIATVITSIASGVYWIPRLGAVGAAWAVALSLFVWSLLQTVEVRQIYRTVQFAPALLKPMIAGVLAALISVTLVRVLVGAATPMVTIPAAVLFGTLYFGGLWLWGIETEDREILATLGRRSV